MPILPKPERFWSKVVKTNKCWLWTGYILPTGYGTAHTSDYNWLAHRAAYTMVKGPIPEGYDLDHTCYVRSCVNPDHLRAVTRGENALNNSSPFSINKRKTHCIRGHNLVQDNRRNGKGWRRCEFRARCASLPHGYQSPAA